MKVKEVYNDSYVVEYEATKEDERRFAEYGFSEAERTGNDITVYYEVGFNSWVSIEY